MTALVQDRVRDRYVSADDSPTSEERRVMRWGGLAGMLGGVLFIAVFVFVGVFIGADPVESEGPITRFPDARGARTVENSLYLAVIVLWIAHLLALYRALRGMSLAPALFGSVVGIAGLVVLAAGALPHVATVPISDLYHAPGTSTVDRATLALLWTAIQGILNELLVVGLVLLPIGIILLGVAMTGTPAFGVGLGWLAFVLGVIGVAAAAVLLVDPLSLVAVVGSSRSSPSISLPDGSSTTCRGLRPPDRKLPATGTNGQLRPNLRANLPWEAAAKQLSAMYEAGTAVSWLLVPLGSNPPSSLIADPLEAVEDQVEPEGELALVVRATRLEVLVDMLGDVGQLLALEHTEKRSRFACQLLGAAEVHADLPQREPHDVALQCVITVIGHLR